MTSINQELAQVGHQFWRVEGPRFVYQDACLVAVHPKLDKHYPITRDCHFQWRHPDWKHFRSFRLRAGVAHDFTTVPWMLRWFLSVVGVHALAAIIHDGCYINHKRIRDGLTPVLFTWAATKWVPAELDKASCDLMFNDAMQALGRDLLGIQRRSAYWAVRRFGQSYWDGPYLENYFINEVTKSV
jgi:hypothetical protein